VERGAWKIWDFCLKNACFGAYIYALLKPIMPITAVCEKSFYKPAENPLFHLGERANVFHGWLSAV